MTRCSSTGTSICAWSPTTLRAPFVVDDEVDIAVLGASAGDRAAEREDMRVAPDLALHDLDGNVHTWSELGRKKKVLATWASW